MMAKYLSNKWISMTCAAIVLAFALEADAKERPKFSEVEQLVRHYFDLNGIQAGEIISQGQVATIFVGLADLGWDVHDQQEILEAVCADDDFLVRLLRTPAAEGFVRKLATLPGGYDRLDRLSRMPYGRQTVRDLVEGPDGYKLLQYMTKTSGGKALQDMLTRAPAGKGFKKPTGRIYTSEQLVRRLRESYNRQQSSTS